MAEKACEASTSGELGEGRGRTSRHGTPTIAAKHIGVLADAGIVGREKDGNRVRCSIADDVPDAST